MKKDFREYSFSFSESCRNFRQNFQTKRNSFELFFQMPNLIFSSQIMMSIYQNNIDISIFLKYCFISIWQNKISIFSIFLGSFSTATLRVWYIFSRFGFCYDNDYIKNCFKWKLLRVKFPKKIWRKHISVYPRSGGRELQRSRCDFIRSSIIWLFHSNLFFDCCYN